MSENRFVVGQIVNLENYGRCEYKGPDLYWGERSLKFVSQDDGREYFVLPAAVRIASEDKPIGGVDHPPPDNYRRSIEHAIGYVSYLCEKSGALNSGETALYWHLYHVVSSHMAPTIDSPAPSEDRETS